MLRRAADCPLPEGGFVRGLDRALVAALASGSVVDPGGLDPARPNRPLGQRLEGLHIPFLDLLPPFAEEGRGRRLY